MVEFLYLLIFPTLTEGRCQDIVRILWPRYVHTDIVTQILTHAGFVL